MFFALPRIKTGRRFFAKTVLSEGAGGGIAAGTERACAVREGRLAFFKKM